MKGVGYKVISDACAIAIFLVAKCVPDEFVEDARFLPETEEHRDRGRTERKVLRKGSRKSAISS